MHFIDLAKTLPRPLGGSWGDYFHLTDEKARSRGLCLPQAPSMEGLFVWWYLWNGYRGHFDILALYVPLVLAFLLSAFHQGTLPLVLSEACSLGMNT